MPVTYIVRALYICGCGFAQRVQVPIDQRVTPEHDCPLKQGHTGEARAEGSAARAS